MNPSRLRWGILFILIGVVFLANNLGWASWWIWADLLQLWPVLLIAIGLELVFKKSRLQAIGYLSTLLIIAAFAWVIFADGTSSYYIGGDSKSESTIDWDNEQKLDMRMEFEDGHLVIGSDEAYLVRAVARNSRDGLSLTDEESGTVAKVLIEPKKRMFRRISDLQSYDNHWCCYLHPDVNLNCNLKIDNSNLRIFGEDLQLDTLQIHSRSSDIMIRIGDEKVISYLHLDGRHSDVIIYLPDSIGIKIEGKYPSQRIINKYNLQNRGDYLTNDLYPEAVQQVHIVNDIPDSKLRLKNY